MMTDVHAPHNATRWRLFHESGPGLEDNSFISGCNGGESVANEYESEDDSRLPLRELDMIQKDTLFLYSPRFQVSPQKDEGKFLNLRIENFCS